MHKRSESFAEQMKHAPLLVSAYVGLTTRRQKQGIISGMLVL